MFLFFDTETTGLPKKWNAPVTDSSNWPRLVQLAYLLYDGEENLMFEGNYIVRPEGFTIPSESMRIHGISTERALCEGLPLQDVLLSFSEILKHADYLVAHNISFDESIIGAELVRCGMANHLTAKIKICTMLGSTNYCAISGKGGYKRPRLSELHQKLFGCGFEEAHNAAADIKATAHCFWELRKRGVIDL